jgi:hypothetical protein
MKIIKVARAVSVALQLMILASQTSMAQNEIAVREYSSENGRTIKLTSTGNLIGLETPAGYENIAVQGSREGYVVSYIDQTGATRVIHDVFNSHSTAFKPGSRDFIPVSFSAPPSTSDLAIDTLISATSVLHTRDGLLRLENVITWRAGTGTVDIRMTLTNRSAAPVKLLNVKRVADINAGGEKSNSSSGQSDSVFYFRPVCTCRPPVPPGPWVPLVVLTGANATALNVLAGDDSELFNVGPGDSLIGRQTDLDTQGVLIFKPNAPLPPGGAMTATVAHDVR